MDDSSGLGIRIQIARSGLTRLNEVSDRFRRLVKLAAIECAKDADGLLTEREVTRAVQQVCRSHWFEQDGVRDGQTDEAA